MIQLPINKLVDHFIINKTTSVCIRAVQAPNLDGGRMVKASQVLMAFFQKSIHKTHFMKCKFHFIRKMFVRGYRTSNSGGIDTTASPLRTGMPCLPCLLLESGLVKLDKRLEKQTFSLYKFIIDRSLVIFSSKSKTPTFHCLVEVKSLQLKSLFVQFHSFNSINMKISFPSVVVFLFRLSSCYFDFSLSHSE